MEEKQKKILIVEDDKNFLWLLRQGFIGENLSVVYALDAESGMDMIEKEKPDLIIADILLPKMDGITMAKKLKEKGNNFPIVFLTNLKDVEHISQAVGIVEETDYIIKSDLHIDQIVARVKEKLGIK